MAEIDHSLPHFKRLMQFAGEGTLDDHLQQLASMTATMLAAEHCSIMLTEDNGDAAPQLAVWASTATLPAAAYREGAGNEQGIAGHVMESGEALRVDDIRESRFADRARRRDDPRRSLMCAPVRLRSELLGVVNVSGRHASGPFEAHELRLLEVVGLVIGKAIQVSQLQSMLDSRFAQMAVIQETSLQLGHSLAAGLPNPDQVAKIMAKSFYKEMTRAGFGSRQIINAASEIITQLSGHLQRHSRRLDRDNDEEPADVP